jgi:hypothetical protein
MRHLKYILMAAVLLIIAGCAGPNKLVGTPVDPAHGVCDFFCGFWHGIIIFFSFIGSLLDSTINIYEVHNNGGWYNFGFMLGIGALGGGASSSSKNKDK